MPVIIAILEAEVGGLQSLAGPKQNGEILYEKLKAKGLEE
jgi:hypothetical protein